MAANQHKGGGQEMDVPTIAAAQWWPLSFSGGFELFLPAHTHPEFL
jgi:hypothetical protein